MRIKNRVIRQLAVTLLSACLVILPMSVQALGFGNIRIKSALNEPLDAEIELLSATKSDLKGLRIQLASNEAFLRAGIERPGHLAKLKFAIKTHSNGRAYLHISTKQSIREPFLDFLLEMNWKNGRMLREYTVLLDPPDRMQQQPTIVESPQTEAPAVVAEQEQRLEQQQESPFVEQQAVAVEERQPEAEPVQMVEEPVVEQAVSEDSIAVADIEAEPIPLAETIPESELLPVEEPVTTEEGLTLETAEVEQDVPEPDPFAGEKFPRIPIKTDKRLRKAEEAELAKLNVEAIADEPVAIQPAEQPIAEEPLAQESLVTEEALAQEPLVAEEPLQAEPVLEETLQEPEASREPVDAVTTKRNDKLWNIAESMRPDESVTIYQVMMALLQSNPDAFVEGNVHRLKTGKVLRIEDPSVLSTMSKSQAAQEYIAQTQAWEDYRAQFAGVGETAIQAETAGGLESAAMDSANTGAGTAPGETAGELVLSAPEGDNQTAGSTGDQQATVNNEVVILREEIRQALAEAEAEGNKNLILNEKLRDLESQLQDLQRSVTVKDDELATLQKQLSDVNKRNIEAEQVEAEQQARAEQESQAMHSEIPGVVTSESESAPAVVSEAEMLAQSQQQEQQAEKPAEAAQQPADKGPGVVDTAFGILGGVKNAINKITSGLPVSPMILTIGGGVIVILLLLMVLLMQRRRQAANFQESILSGIPSHEIMASEEASMETNLSGESSFLSDFAISGASALQGDDGDVDPLTEADVFMAYGRYEAAEERIKEAIKNDPDRQELRIKLLELYNTTKNKAAFENAAEQMYASIGNDASNPMWQKVLVMGAMLVPENPLFSDSGPDVTRIRKNEDVTRIRNMPEKDANNDILDLGMDDDLSGMLPKQPAIDDLGLDLDFASDTSDEPSQALDFDFETAAGEDTAQVENSIDLDFNFDNADKSAQDEVSGLDFDMPTNNTDELDLSGLDLSLEETAETEVALNLDMDESDLSAMDLKLDDNGESSLGLTLDMDLDTAVAEKANDGLTMELAQPTFNEMEMPTMEAEVDATDMADLDSPSVMDEVGTKLDLAKAYIDMGDPDGARSILDEVLEEGTPPQQQEAQELMQQI